MLNTLVFVLFLSFVQGALYVIEPQQSTVCRAGQPCTIQWLDDGIAPLLSSIGVCTVGLYSGNQQLIQEIEPVNVANAHSLTFKPNSKAGPNSNDYYVTFTSTADIVNGTSPYLAFSPPFNINNMHGSFNSPLPSATSTIPIPSSLLIAPTSSSTETVTIGTLSTSLPPISSLSSTSPHPSASPSAKGQISAGHRAGLAPMVLAVFFLSWLIGVRFILLFV